MDNKTNTRTRIGVGSVVDELFQRAEATHHDRGHHLLDDALQPDARQRVGIDDGYFYRALARYWCRIVSHAAKLRYSHYTIVVLHHKVSAKLHWPPSISQ